MSGVWTGLCGFTISIRADVLGGVVSAAVSSLDAHEGVQGCSVRNSLLLSILLLQCDARVSQTVLEPLPALSDTNICVGCGVSPPLLQPLLPSIIFRVGIAH